MSAPISIEVPVFEPAHATAALAIGAHRVELNRASSYPAGGLTPTTDERLSVLTALADPSALRIMIRPRGPPTASPPASDFIYTAAELADMHRCIDRARQASATYTAQGAGGYVFGCLAPTADRLDTAANRALVQAAVGAPCTLHRAVDQVLQAAQQTAGDAGVRAVVDQIVECGFVAVLTSGGPGCAVDNGATLRVFCEAARGRLEVVVGGGVRSDNVHELVEAVGDMHGVVLHSSCWVDGQFSEEELRRLLETTGN
ncbi:hypothetical protein Cpir12675_000445 [Ceratocystis pirilliformis]|uniref:Copper homeostasis protein cutC homolog n=1 Tax=Ceratocystis pirilliformis TaxID=259994 RepID=A0ABR3ZLN4_9PEZI